MIPAYRPRRTTESIILHASHTVPGERQHLQQFLAAQGRGMGLIEIGYHFLILHDGHLIETRPHNAIGSHCPGYNKRSIGVCLEGGRLPAIPEVPCEEEPADNFSEAQWDTLRSLKACLVPYYGELPVHGHTDLGHHKHREAKCPPTSRRD